ncbi:MAG: stage II sporulation protein R, partial [Oscillospiraceae bacterium]|nr:stage II sporulation protein R [Oscillospiraceae bacterium]
SAAEGRQVRVRLGPEPYPTRRYAAFTLPAGTYESLQVILGEGQGHNWWCVVFPPLCLTAAEAEPVQSVMSPGDFALVSGQEGYELRFRLVELWGALTARLGK